MLKIILKILLILVLIAAVAAFNLWIVWIKGNPWWVGLVVIAGLLGLAIAVIYLKKYFLRRREKEFVRNVIAQNEASIERAPIHERTHLKELQEKWKESVELLRGSYLRKKGNPLYVLPWYLILGESGAGKTSAIKNTNLNSPITEVSRTTGISVTRNCDWWFFEEAIILDTAGRYTIPIDEGVDKEEWEEFLILLSKYRRKEPLNGVIVTIATDKLLELNEARLSDEGQSVRKRIDQLMRILGAKFPIYILVSKLDLVQGMIEFSNLLPKNARDQAMGYINKNANPDWKTVLDNTFSGISREVKEMQLIMVHQEDFIEPEVLLFNNGFERLRLGLELFAQAVFETNPYQETPLFRGVFFSSAIQESKLPPETEKLFGVNKREIQDIAHNNGLFLKDIFKKILPKDRNLFIPIKEFISLRRITTNTGLISWVLLWLFLGGIMSLSYFTNLNAIKVTGGSYNLPVMTGQISQDIIKLDQLRSKIIEMEKANKKWFIPRVGFQHSLAMEVKIKIRFLQIFRDGVLYPLDAKLIHELEKSNIHSDKDIFWNHFEYLDARITLLREYRDGANTFSIEQFIAATNDLLMNENSSLSLEAASMFGEIYRDYLTWNEDKHEFSRQLDRFQAVMDKLLQMNVNLNRIILDSITGVTDINLSDFWGNTGGSNHSEQVSIPGAYTNEGIQQIGQIFEKIEGAAVEKTVITKRKRAFLGQYQMQFYDAWSNFSRRFHMNNAGAADAAVLKQTASMMATDHNPHFLFLERMAEEFAHVPKIHDEPSWAGLVREINEVRKQTLTENEKEKKSLLDKIETKKVSLVKQTLGKIDRQKARELKLRQDAALIWIEYTEALAQIAPALTSRILCFQMVSENSMSPLTDADNKFLKLKGLLDKNESNAIVWTHVTAPQRFMADYIFMEATCVLQELWDEQVLGGIQGVESDKIPGLLFAESDGLILQFIETTGKPFITRNIKGYYSRNVAGRTMSFKAGFFDFLNKGPDSIVSYEPEYIVAMETLPLEVNDEAKTKPHACILGLQCADGKHFLENYNFPQSQTFHWSPEQCGDVTLTILFADTKITRRYEGAMGFAQFLSEFRDGSRTFRADEFSRDRQFLNNNAVSWIRLSYKISGSAPVVRLLEKKPLRIPMEIVDCRSK